MNNNMQDILKNYYASGGKTLFEAPIIPQEIDEPVDTEFTKVRDTDPVQFIKKYCKLYQMPLLNDLNGGNPVNLYKHIGPTGETDTDNPAVAKIIDRLDKSPQGMDWHAFEVDTVGARPPGRAFYYQSSAPEPGDMKPGGGYDYDHPDTTPRDIVVHKIHLQSVIDDQYKVFKQLQTIMGHPGVRTEQLEEGVFTTAMVFAGLVSLLSGGPKTEPVDNIDNALKSEIQTIYKDINNQEKTLDVWKYDPQYIADMFGLPLESVIHPRHSEEFGKPVAGYDPSDSVYYNTGKQQGEYGQDDLAPDRISKELVQVDYSKRLQKNKQSPIYTTGGYTINVLRSSVPLKETMLNPDMDLKETVYLSTCFIEATQMRNNNKYYASKIFRFYHKYSGAIDSLQKCRPDMMVKALETAFKTNPVLIDPNRP